MYKRPPPVFSLLPGSVQATLIVLSKPRSRSTPSFIVSRFCVIFFQVFFKFFFCDTSLFYAAACTTDQNRGNTGSQKIRDRFGDQDEGRGAEVGGWQARPGPESNVRMHEALSFSSGEGRGAGIVVPSVRGQVPMSVVFSFATRQCAVYVYTTWYHQISIGLSYMRTN